MDLKILNEHVDFFLLDSVVYRPCEYHKHQADMNVLATAEDIVRNSMSHLYMFIFLQCIRVTVFSLWVPSILLLIDKGLRKVVYLEVINFCRFIKK